MCGIIGYIGNDANESILDGLELLEYRGYDSAGLAIRNENSGDVEVYKCKGRVKDLREKVPAAKDTFCVGIGHTRWATHGGVCDENAHPHRVGKVTLVHNGIIENYAELTAEYHLAGHLVSETDTEVAAALLAHFYEGDPYQAIYKTVSKLHGTYALVIMFDDIPDTIFAIRNVSPIVVSKDKDQLMLASDPTAIYQFANRFFVLEEGCVLRATKDDLVITDPKGTRINPEYQIVDWDTTTAGKAGHPFYMEKEIFEQPEAIRRLLDTYVDGNEINLGYEGKIDAMLADFDRVCIVACGTALHAGMVGASLLKKWAKVPVETEMASEFIYSDAVLSEKTLFIAVSQSGETVDTMEALKKAKADGAATVAVLNVRGSSISRQADYSLFTDAGPEIAVASTKAYTTQLLVFYLLALKTAEIKGTISEDEKLKALESLKMVPDAIQEVIENKHAIHLAANNVLTAEHLFMIGRGLDYLSILEGSLKLKEISYIHSEAYAAGELKHGTIALITDGTPVIAAATQTALLSKELSNVKEVRARGANVVVLTKKEVLGELPAEYASIGLPNLPDEFMTFPEVTALQLFAYFVSSDKGLDVDKPRNLAKVVTVE